MCKKKIVDPQPDFTDKTVSANVCGDFPGTANDLQGPPRDAVAFRKKVESLWPDMTFRKFQDGEMTRRRLLSEIEEAISHVGPDGMLFFIMDICHAESATRNGGPRTFPGQGMLRGIGYDKVLVFSSSLSSQYSSDAQFTSGAFGAWHYALINTLERGITYLEWFNRAKALLAKAGFTQIPVIEGPMSLQNRLVFEGNVETIEVSSHGGQIADRDGDEPDRKDEVVFTVDGKVSDDEIRALIEGWNSRGLKIRPIITKLGRLLGFLR